MTWQLQLTIVVGSVIKAAHRNYLLVSSTAADVRYPTGPSNKMSHRKMGLFIWPAY